MGKCRRVGKYEKVDFWTKNEFFVENVKNYQKFAEIIKNEFDHFFSFFHNLPTYSHRASTMPSQPGSSQQNPLGRSRSKNRLGLGRHHGRRRFLPRTRQAGRRLLRLQCVRKFWSDCLNLVILEIFRIIFGQKIEQISEPD